MENIIGSSSLRFIVGTVREIKGTSVIIRMFENTSQLVHFYEGKKYSGVMIGSYIGIVRGQYTIVAKVEKEYAYDVSKDTNVQEFKKDRFVREIEVKIIGSFKSNSYESGLVAFPQIFNDVILLSDNQKEVIIEGDGGASSNDGSGPPPTFQIGYIWPEGIPYRLKWYNLFNSHIAIFGNTGSGKSNTLTKIYYELFNLRLKLGSSRFVFIDFNGEYIGDETITSAKKVIRLSTQLDVDGYKNRLTIPKSKFWDKDLLSVLFGATEQTQQPFIGRVLEYYFRNDEAFESNIKAYIVQAFGNVYMAQNKNSLDLLKQIIELVGLTSEDISDWIGNSQYNQYTQNFCSNIELVGWTLSNKSNLYYWNAEEDELNKEKKCIVEKLKNKRIEVDNPMRQLQIAAYLKMIFELRLNTVQYDHIAPLLHRIEARTNDLYKVIRIEDTTDIFNETVTVISLKDVNQDMKLLLPMIIAKISYDINKENNDKKDSIFNLVIDEAHNILSETSSRESEKWKDYRLEVFEEIIKEGRKFGYFLTLASQRPADISPTIVSQIHNYFIHRLVNDNDLRLLDKTMTSLDSVSKGNIPNLAPGQVILTGTSFELPLIIKIDRLNKEIAPNSGNISLENIWNL